MALLTIMMASWRDLSVSSMNCSAPPLRIMVQVLAWGQPVNKLYLKKRIRFYDTIQKKAESGAIISCIQYSNNILQIISSHYFLASKETYLSPPIWISSNFSQEPSTLLARFWQVVWMEPPHAFIVLFRSSSGTRPAQNMSLNNMVET